MTPYSPIPRIVAGTSHEQLIHRILRADVPPDTLRIDLITTSFRRVSLVDSGVAPEAHIAEGDTAVHVLWQRDESGAIVVGSDHYPIAPGDTVMIPAGDPWQLPPNTLAVLVVTKDRSLALPIPPTHGAYDFVGHNRASLYPAMGAIRLSRWKLSHNLAMPAPERERVLIGLYNDIAVQYASGVSMLRQGEASVIRPETGGITLVANGLSYVLVID